LFSDSMVKARHRRISAMGAFVLKVPQPPMAAGWTQRMEHPLWTSSDNRFNDRHGRDGDPPDAAGALMSAVK
jgi:hypothetical protein